MAGAIFRLHPIICSIKSFNRIVFDVQFPAKLGMELTAFKITQIFIVMDIRCNRKIISAISMKSSLSVNIKLEFFPSTCYPARICALTIWISGTAYFQFTTIDGSLWNYTRKIYLKAWKCRVITMNSLRRVMIRHYATFCSWQVNELCFLELCISCLSLIITVLCISFNSQAEVLYILLLIYNYS